VLRRRSGPKRHEVTEDWRTLHNKELHALHSSPDIIRVIKPRRLRLAWHVARMRQRRGAYRVLVGKPKRRRPLERPSADERIILKWIFKKWDGGSWTGSIWLRIGARGGHL
jgi:hypothetical protein